MTVPNYTYLKL
jgi:hypothetical protein